MSLKQICACAHDIDTHYKDPHSGRREACLGYRCDCRCYRDVHERDTPLLPPNNYDESKTFYGGGRPHIDCNCLSCLEWDYERMKHLLNEQWGW
jgi:hypothetical protein